MDIVALATQVAEDEEVVLPSAPKKRREVRLQNLSAFARGHEALLMRRDGKEWHEIAEELGYKSPAVAYNAALSARKKLAIESRDDLRFRQRMRIDKMLQALDPSIKRRDKNTPRAVEVAVKLLEREARLEGLDLEGAAQDQGNKAIIINVQPHPEDQGARELAASHGRLLQAPIVDVQQFEEVHLSDRGDGLGEDVGGSVLGTEKT